MIHELVFVFATPPLQRDIDKYAISELFAIAVPVTVIDISPLASPVAYKRVTAPRMCDSRTQIHICKCQKELEQIIKEKPVTAIFLPMFDCYYAVRFFYAMMTKYKKNYGYVNNASGDVAPILDEMEDSYLSLSTRIQMNGNLYSYVRGAIYNRLLRKIFVRNKAKFTVIAGSEREAQFIHQGECNSKTKIIHTHSFDFERFKNTDPYKSQAGEYCVFLDIFLPFHPDSAQMGYIVDPDAYYSELCDMLDNIKQKFKLNILIAAHPRADYSGDRKKYYRNYKIEYGLTAALVKNAKLVISHYSTSTAFAVMANIPVIILDMKLFKNYPLWYQMNRTYANLLQATMIRDKKEINSLAFPMVNENAYKAFKEKYIGICADEQKNIWENIIYSMNF